MYLLLRMSTNIYNIRKNKLLNRDHNLPNPSLKSEDTHLITFCNLENRQQKVELSRYRLESTEFTCSNFLNFYLWI